MPYISEFFTFFVLVIIGLLPIMNPLATIPLYLSLTKHMTETRKREQAKKTCIFAFAILVTFLLLGNGIIKTFSISLAGIRVAGGIIILIIALRMIFSGMDASKDVEASPEDIKSADLDYSFSPLAMPGLAGPGSIAVVMGFTSQIPSSKTGLGYLVVISGVLFCSLLAYVALLFSNRLAKMLGEHGMQAITKIMGFLLTCIAVQFLASGIQEFVLDFTKLAKV